MTRFTVMMPCSSVSPAMAKTSPSRYTWRSSDARSKARYSSSVRNGLCLGMPIAKCSDQDVVAVAPVRRELDGAGRQARGLYRVVVCARVDVEPIRRLRAGDVNLGR